MLRLVSSTPAPTNNPRSHCPDCEGALAVLRVIPGRAGFEEKSEYWTQRCTRCGGIHLDIVKAALVASKRHAESVPDRSPAVPV